MANKFIWVVIAIVKDIPVSAATTHILYLPATNGNDALNQAQKSHPDCQTILVDRLSPSGLMQMLESIEP